MTDMGPGQIVYQGTSKKGKSIIIRYPTMADVPAMRDYINAISLERTFISYQGEQVTLDEEARIVEDKIKKFATYEAVMLLAICEDKLVGITGLDMGERVGKHVGNMGISVAKDFRGEGIGTLLMQLTLDEAVKNIPQLAIMTLSVFATNDLALKMYKKFGFVEYGNLPNGAKLPGGYVDHVYMYKVVKK